MLEKKLGRKLGHRKSLLRNLATSLVLYEQIDTTRAKAKEVRPCVEKLISIGKKHDLTAYRKLLSYFYDRNAAKKIYHELSDRYAERNSGFVRVFHLEPRLGDNSEMIRLQLVDHKVFIDKSKKKEKKSTSEQKPDTDKINKKTFRAEKKLEKLTKTQEKSGIVTSVRTKAARKTGV